MNDVKLLGRLTRDPEVRYGQSGSAVANFSVAIDRRYKRDGETTADFFNCTAFGKTGEFVEKYLRKGVKVVIEGELQNNNYEDKNGTKYYSVQIIVNQIEFAESKRQGDAPTEQPKQTEGPKADDGFASIPDDLEVDMPFR